MLDGFSDAAEAAIVDGLASFLDINPTYVELSTAEFVMSGSDVELNINFEVSAVGDTTVSLAEKLDNAATSGADAFTSSLGDALETAATDLELRLILQILF